MMLKLSQLVVNEPTQDGTLKLTHPLRARLMKIEEIANILCVSAGTVKTHVHRILQKFGVEDRTQAVVMAIRQHIVQ